MIKPSRFNDLNIEIPQDIFILEALIGDENVNISWIGEHSKGWDIIFAVVSNDNPPVGDFEDFAL